MAKKMLLRRRVFAIVGVLFVVAALAILPGGAAYRPVPAAAADAAPLTVAPETQAALANAHPGDRVNVVLQSTIQLTVAVLGGPSGQNLGYCPVPSPVGTPTTATDFASLCGGAFPGGFASAADIPKPGLRPDPVGPGQLPRFEFTLIIPDQGQNVIPPTDGGNTNEINCSPGHTCSFGFEYRYTPATPGAKLTTMWDVTSLTFKENAIPQGVEGCSEPQAGRLIDAAGPVRMSDAAAGWAKERCGGSGAQDLSVTQMDDVQARDTFRAGGADIFFGAGGVTAEEDPKAAAKRKSVPVPLGLNAMVLAVYGKSAKQSIGTGSSVFPAPITDVKLTTEQFASLVATPNNALLDGPFAADILHANPQIAPISTSTFDTTSIAAYATPEVGHSLVSRYFASRAPDVWKYPNSVAYGDNAGKPIGELWDLGSLSVNPGKDYNLVSNRTDMSGVVNKDYLGDCAIKPFATLADGCLNFVLTDAATAKFFDLPVAQIENPAGKFVAPTQQAMAAAAGHMTSLPDGSMVANLSSTDPNAYPLTFVENAYAPAQAMVDGNCKASAKQALLNDELGFMVGHPQDLAPGMVPLTTALANQAHTNMAKVGKEQPACAKSSGGTNAGLSSGAFPTGAGATGPGGPGTPPKPAGALGNHPTRPTTTAGQQAALQTANDTKIPPFAGLAALVLLIPLTALALTNAVTSGTAFGSAGRPLPRRLQKVVNTLSRALNLAIWPVRRLIGG